MIHLFIVMFNYCKPKKNFVSRFFEKKHDSSFRDKFPSER